MAVRATSPVKFWAFAGRKRTQPDDEENKDKITSEAAFMRKRRREVDAAAGSVNLSEAVNPVMGSVGVNGWGEGHEKDFFLETKLLGRLMKAIAEGAVPWDSLSPAMQDWFRQWQQHDQELCQEALKSRRLSLTRPSFPNVAGLKVWWGAAVQVAVGEFELHRLSRKMGLVPEESKYQAEMHIWTEVTEPQSQEDKLLAGLHGKLVRHPLFQVLWAEGQLPAPQVSNQHCAHHLHHPTIRQRLQGGCSEHHALLQALSRNFRLDLPGQLG